MNYDELQAFSKEAGRLSPGAFLGGVAGAGLASLPTIGAASRDQNAADLGAIDARTVQRRKLMRALTVVSGAAAGAIGGHLAQNSLTSALKTYSPLASQQAIETARDAGAASVRGGLAELLRSQEAAREAAEGLGRAAGQGARQSLTRNPISDSRSSRRITKIMKARLNKPFGRG